MATKRHPQPLGDLEIAGSLLFSLLFCCQHRTMLPPPPPSFALLVSSVKISALTEVFTNGICYPISYFILDLSVSKEG